MIATFCGMAVMAMVLSATSSSNLVISERLISSIG
jgi:hypothetical protein